MQEGEGEVKRVNNRSRFPSGRVRNGRLGAWDAMARFDRNHEGSLAIPNHDVLDEG